MPPDPSPIYGEGFRFEMTWPYMVTIWRSRVTQLTPDSGRVFVLQSHTLGQFSPRAFEYPPVLLALLEET